jgi:hypothetical protein
MTRPTAQSISSHPTVVLALRAADMAASFIKFSSYAPENPCVRRLIASKSTFAATVDAENARVTFEIGQADRNFTIKAAGTQQGLVEDIDPIGRGNGNDAGIAVKAVHFDQNRINGLFPLIVTAGVTGSTLTADGINLIKAFLAWENTSRTRLAPIRTNISTNSLPEMLLNGTPASPKVSCPYRAGRRGWMVVECRCCARRERR